MTSVKGWGLHGMKITAGVGLSSAAALSASVSFAQTATTSQTVYLAPDNPTTLLGAVPDPETLFKQQPCNAGFVHVGAPVPLNETPPAYYTNPQTQYPPPPQSAYISLCDGPRWATSDPADCSVVTGFYWPNMSGLNDYCKVSVALAPGSSPQKTYYKKETGGGNLFGQRKDEVFDPGLSGQTRIDCRAYSDFGKNTCSVDGWVSPNDPSDLRCRVHIGAASTQGYSCNVIIKYQAGTAPPPPVPPPPPRITAPGTINVTRARIGCLDIQTDGNLTAIVSAACDSKTSCAYKAPTEAQYKSLGVQARTQSFCTQGMDIDYNCGDGRAKTASVPGDAWTHPAAELACEPPPAPPPRAVAAAPQPPRPVLRVSCPRAFAALAQPDHRDQGSHRVPRHPDRWKPQRSGLAGLQ